MTESRVMPGRIEDVTDGVYSVSSRTMKRFWPLPSLTVPAVSSAIASV